MVREGASLSSSELPERLQRGATVEASTSGGDDRLRATGSHVIFIGKEWVVFRICHIYGKVQPGKNQGFVFSPPINSKYFGFNFFGWLVLVQWKRGLEQQQFERFVRGRSAAPNKK